MWAGGGDGGIVGAHTCGAIVLMRHNATFDASSRHERALTQTAVGHRAHLPEHTRRNAAVFVYKLFRQGGRRGAAAAGRAVSG